MNRLPACPPARPAGRTDGRTAVRRRSPGETWFRWTASGARVGVRGHLGCRWHLEVPMTHTVEPDARGAPAPQRRAAEGPQAAPPHDDRHRRRHRSRPLRGLRRRDHRDRAGRLPHLRGHRRADRPRDADARRDGHGEPVDRVLRRLLPDGARRLGGLLGRVALLVLLGDRGRLRGRRRRRDHHLLDRRPAVAALPRADGPDDGHQPGLGVVVRRVRVLVRQHQGRRDRGLPRARAALRRSACGPASPSTSAT